MARSARQSPCDVTILPVVRGAGRGVRRRLRADDRAPATEAPVRRPERPPARGAHHRTHPTGGRVVSRPRHVRGGERRFAPGGTRLGAHGRGHAGSPRHHGRARRTREKVATGRGPGQHAARGAAQEEEDARADGGEVLGRRSVTNARCLSHRLRQDQGAGAERLLRDPLLPGAAALVGKSTTSGLHPHVGTRDVEVRPITIIFFSN